MNILQNGYIFLKRILLPHNDPCFIIAGVQKSGTTSLYYYLNQHPELCGSNPKELHYFNRDYYFGKSYTSYKSHFTGSSKKKYFEATPAYIYHPNAMANMKVRYPGMKIVLILREPVSRAFSAWHHYRDLYYKNKGESLVKFQQRDGNLLYELFFKNRDKFPSFRECIEIEFQLMENVSPPFEPSLIRRGLYYQQLKKCLESFPDKNVLVIGFRDFINNSKETVNRICRFVNVSPLGRNQNLFIPINKRRYKEIISAKDKIYIEQFYVKHNKKLIDLVGEINW